MAHGKTQPPLAVDLDGSLLKSDLLAESLLALLRTRPLQLLSCPAWLAQGRGRLKEALAERVTLDVASLPYDGDLVEHLRSEKDQGRTLVLATAATRKLAEAVAGHLGLFTEVLASSDGVNLKGRAKAEALVSRFGEKGFDYAGNDSADMEVWARARGVLLVRASPEVEREVMARWTPAKVFPRKPSASAMFRAVRAHQWVKNLLIFVPTITAHRLADAAPVTAAARAFIAFCALSSIGYIINDLLDLPSDRRHPQKQARPFASGEVSILTGLAWIPLLLTAAAAASWGMPGGFLWDTAAYLGLTTLYSLRLKRIVLLDVVTLALLYTIRLEAGGDAASIPISHWLEIFSMFIFISLAFLKRYTELRNLKHSGAAGPLGREYQTEDLAQLAMMGTSSGYISVLVFALYIYSPEVKALYSGPQLLWGICIILLYWISSMWLSASRGKMDEDPVVFASADPLSWCCGAGILAVMAASALHR